MTTFSLDGVLVEYTGAEIDVLRAVLETNFDLLAATGPVTLDSAKAWSLRVVKQLAIQRKAAIFSAASDYDPVELIEMIAEARDYRITGNTAAARYPLAGALATARGVTLVVVLTAWGDALQTAFGRLAVLIDRQEQAEAAINGAGSLIGLREVMAAILAELEG